MPKVVTKFMAKMTTETYFLGPPYAQSDATNKLSAECPVNVKMIIAIRTIIF
jgi:hypothetical protein